MADDILSTGEGAPVLHSETADRGPAGALGTVGAADTAVDDEGVVTVIRDDDGNWHVTDDAGRRLVIRKVNLNEQALLYEAAEDVTNFQWTSLASAACAVRMINDVPLPFPSTKKQVQARLAAVGDEGVRAASGILMLMMRDRKKTRYELAGENAAAAKN